MCRRTDSEFHIGNNGEAIEELETDLERELLAREGVDERLEYCGEPRRLQTAEPISQFSQMTITLRHSVPLGQVDAQSEQPIHERSDFASVHSRAG